MNRKKLYRSTQNRVLCGICGGIGDYFQVDPVMVRLIWVFLVLLNPWRSLFHSLMGFSLVGGSIVVYIIAAVIIPQEPKDRG